MKITRYDFKMFRSLFVEEIVRQDIAEMINSKQLHMLDLSENDIQN